MKNMVLALCILLLLSGCAAQTFETVDDLNDVPAIAQPATVLLDLPDQAATPAMKGSSGTLYFCGDYDISVEIMPSGNLNSTMMALTGFDREELNLMQTIRCGVNCYEGAWSAAGEAGDHIGRVLVMDDGSFHYCVSLMASAEDAGDCSAEWKEILDSVALAEG